MNHGSFFATSSAMNIPTSNDSQPIDISYQRSSSNFQQPSRFRRESIAHSSGMGGVSWGSVTIGSWLKDEVLMFNNLTTSSMTMSPPNNQASYLPDLEANYCKDYSCCGQLLPTLHDLLRHYEEAHISPSPPLEAPRSRPMQNIMETVSTNEVFLSQTNNSNHHHIPSSNHHNNIHHNNNHSHHNQIPNHSNHPHNLNHQTSHGNLMSHNQLSHNSNQTLNHHTSLNGLNMSLNHHHSNNHNNNHITHDNSNSNYNHHSNLSSTQINGEEDDEMCIDDPARHLYVIERGEHKPFKCPVIGCEKTYKNQNGLKYHRLHGHQNQTLHQNADGSFSIIDPESNTPYPDGAGMEKDKPYRCEVCGKRYKNLNGLKYHRGHSTH